MQGSDRAEHLQRQQRIVGKIEDLVISPRTGEVRYAVLSFGGILGIGDKYFAVPGRKLSS